MEGYIDGGSLTGSTGVRVQCLLARKKDGRWQVAGGRMVGWQVAGGRMAAWQVAGDRI